MPTAITTLLHALRSRRELGLAPLALLAVRAPTAGAGNVAGNLGGGPRRTPEREEREDRRERHRFVLNLNAGQLTRAPADQCAEQGQVCHVGLRGAGRAKPLGPVTYVLTLAADFGKATPGPGGAVCAPLTGKLSLRAKRQRRAGQVTGTVAGRVCVTEGPTFATAYTITNGTNTYDGATGRSSLNITFTEGDGGFEAIKGHGHIRY